MKKCILLIIIAITFFSCVTRPSLNDVDFYRNNPGENYYVFQADGTFDTMGGDLPAYVHGSAAAYFAGEGYSYYYSETLVDDRDRRSFWNGKSEEIEYFYEYKIRVFPTNRKIQGQPGEFLKITEVLQEYEEVKDANDGITVLGTLTGIGILTTLVVLRLNESR